MKLHVINTGFFKLDGGAMFGVVPKSIWNRLNPADENNMCNWAMRCLLIEDGERKILIDTGIGDKQSEKFFGYYYLSGEDTLLGSLGQAGFSEEEITDVILTHLHFDHCGGAVKREGDGFSTVFPNAIYWSHQDHWQHAMDPNPREKASFLKENFVPIQEAGQLRFVGEDLTISEHVTVKVVNGHTSAMMIPVIQYAEQKIAFCADLIPSAGHVPVNYVMSYDIEPLNTMLERAQFLEWCMREDVVLFFEHDPVMECGRVGKNDRGAFRSSETFALEEIL